jgi:hypothetical protein
VCIYIEACIPSEYYWGLNVFCVMFTVIYVTTIYFSLDLDAVSKKK